MHSRRLTRCLLNLRASGVTPSLTSTPQIVGSSDAERAGYAAYIDGVDPDDCPYDGNEASEWYQGWMSADDRVQDLMIDHY
jgi:ribosome modulation factor